MNAINMQTRGNVPARGRRGAVTTAADDQDSIDLGELLAILWRRKWLIALIVALGTTLGTLAGTQIEKQYTATAAVMLEPTTPDGQVVNLQQVVAGLTGDIAGLATQVRLLTARDQVARVMDDMNLFQDPEYNPAMDPENVPDNLDYAIGGPIERLLALLPDNLLIASGLAKEKLPVLESEAPALNRQAALDRFARNLQVKLDDPSYVMLVSFTSEDPAKAANIANRISQIYVQDQIASKSAATIRASGWLEERLVSLKAEVAQAEQAVETFRAENDIVTTQDVTLNDQQLSDLNRQLIESRAEMAAAEAKLRLARDMRGGGVGLDTIGEVLNSPVVIALRNQESDLLRRENDLRQQFGARHPLIQQIATEKQQLYGKISAEVSRIISNLGNEVQVIGTKVATLEQELDRAKGTTVKDRDAEIKLRELQRQADASRALYEQFLQRSKETREQEALIEPDAKIISVAAPPNFPSTPGPRLFGMVGFAGSLVAGSLLSLLLERRDRGLRSSRQVERLLGMQPLALVPRLDRLKRNQKPHQYLMAKPLSAYTESIRSVLTTLKLSSIDNPPKVILVTSSLPQEGKSTFVASLAAFAARSQKKVILVDLDLRHPSVARELGRPVAAGIVEFMVGDRTLDEVVQHDPATGLDFLPVKRQTANPTDLLDSQKMRLLIETLRQTYDYVFLDCAPVMSVTDSRVAALLADRIVFCVRWSKTPQDAVTLSFETLRQTNVPIGGVVVTQVDVKKHAQYGYGDVAQYYGKYQDYYVN
ncbi:MAG TPA: polysaccharide biosynthesis tyrosine autokinase [Geminicoccus sp.]|jgi:capsular exopolysaccharide synthesis family protein|uniref:GumC family protein n=1 Tax=Geminicoccus sp. TaxID=2024832 RepID=UPI002E37F6DA|nr:polysaccharide biosynthesis tyrosine autokinase [Geminicoccus sp.]HEX2525913.1 polysaccharide biosynthesis tyrosine autokinase [Geminicoccus sp.]